MTTEIRIPYVIERDVDLLLLEELVASPRFQAWLLSRVGVEVTAHLVEAHHSVNTLNGESDLELTFQTSSGLIKILIENKVGAAFQPNQPERYQERARQYMASGEFQAVRTAITAPRNYFGDEDLTFGFDASVTYEDVLAWFEQTDTGARKTYKLAILRGAIERGRFGWKLIPHPGVSNFWRAYWDLCEQLAPQLLMPIPKAEIPADSHFIVFKPAGLPADVSLLHKVAFGHVDLQFSGMGDKLTEMERLYRSSLEPSMRIEKAVKSAVIRIRVEPLYMTTPFADAEPSIRKAIQAAEQLLGWYCDHSTTDDGT